jgi:hypothetical protein
MKVFRHEYIAVYAEAVAPPVLFQDGQEQSLDPVVVE